MESLCFGRKIILWTGLVRKQNYKILKLRKLLELYEIWIHDQSLSTRWSIWDFTKVDQHKYVVHHTGKTDDSKPLTATVQERIALNQNDQRVYWSRPSSVCRTTRSKYWLEDRRLAVSSGLKTITFCLN